MTPEEIEDHALKSLCPVCGEWVYDSHEGLHDDETE